MKSPWPTWRICFSSFILSKAWTRSVLFLLEIILNISVVEKASWFKRTTGILDLLGVHFRATLAPDPLPKKWDTFWTSSEILRRRRRISMIFQCISDYFRLKWLCKSFGHVMKAGCSQLVFSFAYKQKCTGGGFLPFWVIFSMFRKVREVFLLVRP